MTWLRVEKRTVLLTPGTNEFYDVQLVLSTRGRYALPSGDPGAFPLPSDACSSTGDLFAGVTSASYSAGSNGFWNASPPTPSGQFFVDPHKVQPGVAGISSNPSAVYGGPAVFKNWIECDLGEARAMTEMTGDFAMTAAVDHPTVVRVYANNAAMPATDPARTYTGAPYPDPVSEGWTEIAGTWSPGALTGGAHTFTPTTAPTGAFRYWILLLEVTTAGQGFVAGSDITEWGGTACVPDAPSPGQWVRGETVTMAGAVGTLAYPYADGSLQIRVDGILITRASYTETDPAAGTFTLAWIPDPSETVRVDYQGR